MTEEDRKFRAKILQLARLDLEKLRITVDPGLFVTSIATRLSQINAGYEELDENGTRSATEVKQEIDSLYVEGQVRSACALYLWLPHSSNPKDLVRSIVEQLSEVNAGYEVLDRTKNSVEILTYLLHRGGALLDQQVAIKLHSDLRNATLLMAAKSAGNATNRSLQGPTATPRPARISRARQRTNAALESLKRRMVEKGLRAGS